MPRPSGGRGRRRRLPPPRRGHRSGLLSPPFSALLGLALALALAGGLACHRHGPEPSAVPPPAIDHGAALPFWGTWEGPELRLSFAGPWVLVEPARGSDAPIELRVDIVRREGQAAFALSTSVAGLAPADFLRPPDWLLLVEGEGEREALALSMGDEPLESYARVAPGAQGPGPLVGPALLHELPLPEALPFAELTACLELAASTCATLEGSGPRAAGCREAVWARCAGHSLDPEAGGTKGPLLLALGVASTTLRYAAGLDAHAPIAHRESVEALVARTQDLAARALARARASPEFTVRGPEGEALDDPTLALAAEQIEAQLPPR